MLVPEGFTGAPQCARTAGTTPSGAFVLLRHRPSDGSLPRDLQVEVRDPDATVADLSAALEPRLAPGPLVVDGRTVAGATPLDRAGIGDGAVVERPAPVPDDGVAVVVLVVTAGFDAGHHIGLAPGPHVLGRSPGPVSDRAGSGWSRIGLEDPTVSGDHLLLRIAPDGTATVTDVGSTNGTRIDGRALVPDVPTEWERGTTLACGAALIELRPPGSAHRCVPAPPPPTTRSRTRPLHRSIRSGDAPEVETVAVPPDPESPPPVTPIGLIAVGGSVAVGLVMVVVLGSLTYAVFALLGPVLLVANALDSKRRRRRTTRLTGRRRKAQLQQMTEDLTRAADAARTALEDRFPGPVAAVERTRHRREHLWERRADHHDAFAVRVATGEVPWQPPMSAERSTLAADVAEVVEAVTLDDAAVGFQLRAGAAVAVVGPAEAARSLARSVALQAVTAHGPADLQLAVLTAPASGGAWDWCGWLPHGRDPAVGNLLAGDGPSAERVASALGSTDEHGPMRLVVVDDLDGLQARRGAVRRVLRVATTGSRLVPLVVVPTRRAVPATVEVVLEVSGDGSLRTSSDLATGTAEVLGVGEATAREAARVLAGFDDPDLDDPGRGLPRSIGLSELLGPERLLAPVLAARWEAARDDPAPRAVIGWGVDGPVEVDLATDGPHVLVAGTTGSGKSELLRTLVASLALEADPDHLAFVLVDFKGGSAFDACALLPHVTGVVTDLDGHLAERALRCLEAELRHRESVLRGVGADDLAGHRRLAPADPLPRLVVVIDEFATLAAELPEFVDSLVGVAQRGRSLGVHLVLATQRPAGAVSDKIRANTALRVALRVEDRTDSVDVIDVPDAADLPRQIPGRALVRFGPRELVAVQTALASARTSTTGEPIRVSPLGLTGPGDHPATRSSRHGASAGSEEDGPIPSDLERLVGATRQAWSDLGGSAPRPVWPEPLSTELLWPVPPHHHAADIGAAELVLGLADDPDRQRQIPFAWRPDDGPLLTAGTSGSGTSTALATTVLAASARWSAAEAHVHVIDMGAGSLAPLVGLPHVGQVVAADDDERQRRLIQGLADDLADRRRRPDGIGRRGEGTLAGPPRRFLVVDGVGGLRERWDPLDPSGTWDRFVEVVTRGAPFGLHVAMAAEGPGSAPHSLVAACGQRLVMRLGDAGDHGAFGISPSSVPPLPPGRGIAADSQLVVQVARPPDALDAAVDAIAADGDPVPAERRAGEVAILPSAVSTTDLLGSGRPLVEADPDGALRVAVGIAEDRLGTAHLVLGPGCHALVAGPPRSGRTSTITAIGRMLSDAGIAVVEIEPGEVPSSCDLERIEGPNPVVVLVDDADASAEDDPLLARLATERRPGRHLVVTGRADRFRSRYAHWTREVRVDRCGILLSADPDLDGDLLATRLPRTWPVTRRPGLAWVVGGDFEGAAQLVRP